MPLTEEQTRLAVIIDTHVREVLAHGGGDAALLMSMADSMGTFKQLLDACTSTEMDALCDCYDGLYRFCEAVGEAGWRYRRWQYSGARVRDCPGCSALRR
jgi:hypothetical protein